MLDLIGADFPWYAVATAVFLLAVTVFRGIRARGGIMAAEIIFVLAALYFLNRFGRELWVSHEVHEQALALALSFGALAPAGALFWWGFRGHLRKAIFFVGKLLVLAAGLFSLLSRSSALSAAMSLLIASVIALGVLCAPWRDSWRSLRRSKAHRRATAEIHPESPESDPHRETLETAVRQADTARAAAESELARLRAEAAEKASRGAAAEAEQAERRRTTLREVRQIRADERSRLASDRIYFPWHPELGLLMAEGWRVLRAEIAAGERIPPIEHDEFFFDVVSRLLEGSDAFHRYFHAEGREIGAALERFTAGEAPLHEARQLVRALRPHQYAPSPVRGPDALLEAWLVPVRRFQERCREQFLAGAVPHQIDLEMHLRDEGLQNIESDRAAWCAAWDESPWIFLGRAGTPGHTPTKSSSTA